MEQNNNSKSNSKRAFILQFPIEMSATEVVAKGEEAGIEFSTSYVWNTRRSVREEDKKQEKVTRSASGTRSSRKAAKVAHKHGYRARATKSVDYVSAPLEELEQQFLQMVLDLGLLRTAQLYESVKAKLEAMG